MSLRIKLTVVLCFCVFLAQGQVKLRQLTSPGHPKIGLVLGGGGAKGAAQIGVLKALEEEGLEFDYISGTSIGSIIGALYSCGYRAKEIEELFLSQKWLSLITGIGNFIDNGNESRRAWRNRRRNNNDNYDPWLDMGLSGADQITELFDSLTHVGDSIVFDQMPIPFRCVATDLKRQEPVTLTCGNLPIALRASMSIPGVFKPVHFQGRTLVDGGMQNNLPVDVVKAMGAEYVIAIDLTQTKHKPRNFSLLETFGIGGILDWVVSRPDWKRYDDNVKATDLYINPSLQQYDVMDFQKEKIEAMIAIGYQEAKKVLKNEK